MSGAGDWTYGGFSSSDEKKDKAGARPSQDLASNPSTSSGSSGTPAASRKSDSGVYGRCSHSGELPHQSSPGPSYGARAATHPRPCHRRSGSVGSPTMLPAGNICPSGRITEMVPRAAARSNVLGSGTGNYGHGSVVRGVNQAADAGAGGRGFTRPMAVIDAQVITRKANNLYKKSKFGDALGMYNQAVMICPNNADYRINRAAALEALGRLGEAVAEFNEAACLDPSSAKARQRLFSLNFRLGQLESARRHIFMIVATMDQAHFQKLLAAEIYMDNCAEAREKKDWMGLLGQRDYLLALGVDSSPMLKALKAEALLGLCQLDAAESELLTGCDLDASLRSCLKNKVFGMLPASYIDIVRAQVEMALGRFENAVCVAKKASEIDPSSIEVSRILSTLSSVATARNSGNDFFKLEMYEEACLAYEKGLKYDPMNHVLLCNRAACRSKLGQWEMSIEDCNKALCIKPNHAKALLRRAESYGEIGRWAESVLDYEVLRKQFPGNNDIADALLHAQVELSWAESVLDHEVQRKQFPGNNEIADASLDAQVEISKCRITASKGSTSNVACEVEEITTLEQFQESIAFPGVSVAQFCMALDGHCTEMTPFVHDLCKRYPSVNFIKVDIRDIPAVAEAENVRTTPTFKIYKNGFRVKEMICPSTQLLESSVKHYVL